ncbi:hypothetical protein KHA96_17200 [Bacillus sp. FJAT-49711]|uniref:hypothetical protein n=1 Tax=Bacillus sp. FJAT-49711 TaxID=2833585 RepID=UPI001BC9DD99|nr:hypothetical protein [Bacillus sp. FJAT-49711]MBS4220052.1 hypothetical protein [Bacillus sp. FJAT-49711]
MKQLENRLVYLFTGEFFAVVTFTLVYFYKFSSNHSYSLMYALFVLNFILLQSSIYWFVKWQSLRKKRMTLSNLYHILAVLKKLNLFLLCVAPLIFIMDMVLLERASFSIFLLTIFVFIFSVIEYINYFYIQLTNYKYGRGKKPSIAKDIERLREMK